MMCEDLDLVLKMGTPAAEEGAQGCGWGTVADSQWKLHTSLDTCCPPRAWGRCPHSLAISELTCPSLSSPVLQQAVSSRLTASHLKPLAFSFSASGLSLSPGQPSTCGDQGWIHSPALSRVGAEVRSPLTVSLSQLPSEVAHIPFCGGFSPFLSPSPFLESPPKQTTYSQILVSGQLLQERR